MWLVFSVYDRVAESYPGQLVLARNEAVAARMFADTVLEQDSQLKLHPDDFELRVVGSFDEQSGSLLGVPPQCVVSAAVVLRVAANVGLDDVRNELVKGVPNGSELQK